LVICLNNFAINNQIVKQKNTGILFFANPIDGVVSLGLTMLC